MNRTTHVIAMAALILAVVGLLRPSGQVSAQAASKDAWKAERNFPPLVFQSTAWLDCTISSTKNGNQTMRTLSGQGFSFMSPFRPLKDSLVKLKGKGMMYKFNSFPTGPIAARFSTLGAGTITEMKAEIEVDVKRFTQAGGPGTNIKFSAANMSADAAYVEFTGVFVRTSDKKRFPFRVVFGSVAEGGGNVLPATARPETKIMAKSVQLGSPAKGVPVTTALYEAEEDVPALK